MLKSKGKLKKILLTFGFDDAVGCCDGHARFLKEWFSRKLEISSCFQRMLIWVIGQLEFWEKEKGDIEFGR